MNKVKDKLQLVLNKMDNIKYGFIDSNCNIYPDNEDDWDNNFQNKYFLQPPEELIKTKHGVCWDQVELERYYLEQDNIECNSYFIVNYDGKIFPTHTFMLVNQKNNYYWLEHAWEPYRGIHQYQNLNDALLDIKDKFNKMLTNQYNINNNETVIYQYQKPSYNIPALSFFEHCELGQKVEIS